MRNAGGGEEGVSTVPLPLYDSSIVDRRIAVSETEAIAAALELKRTYGYSVGVSAGADFAAVKNLGGNEKGNCVIIFPDNGDRYKLE